MARAISFAISRLVHAYLNSIRFGDVATLRSTKSPYDAFLEKNELPREPPSGQSAEQYVYELTQAIASNRQFKWISEGSFRLHEQAYEFGPLEFRGLRLFLSRNPKADMRDTSAGNCVACHPPPHFTDFGLHNTGVSQFEYDRIFGAGAFEKIRIPNGAERAKSPSLYLPATRQHPEARDRFRSTPSKSSPGHVDLGAWNIYANPDFPAPQKALTALLCLPSTVDEPICDSDVALRRSIAAFKTPSLRDLGHSDPYFHSGTAQTVDEVLAFYRQASRLARLGRLREGSKELEFVRLNGGDEEALAAFVRSLNEDYH